MCFDKKRYIFHFNFSYLAAGGGQKSIRKERHKYKKVEKYCIYVYYRINKINN